MGVWYFINNTFFKQLTLPSVGLILLLAAFITTLFLADYSLAVQSTNKTVNFQGRLLRSNGSVVPDGNYSIRFKIYEGGSGNAQGNPDGVLRWTEDYVASGENSGIKIRNGYFSTNLGSKNHFGSAVNWDNDTLWLSMEFNNDGEMLPMKRITATPYSINSGAVGGKTADDLVQLGQGAQTDASNNSSIFINKTGSGNLLQLQAGGQDAFTLNSNGQITLGAVENQSISVTQSNAGSGKSLTFSAGSAANGSDQGGGDLILQGGSGGGIGPNGSVIVKSSSSNQNGAFQVQDTAGESIFSVDTDAKVVSVGNLNIAAAADQSQVSTDQSLSISSGGDMSINSGSSDLNLQGGSVNIAAGVGGNVNIQGGGGAPGGNGGSLILSGGQGNASGANGLVVINTPAFATSDADDNCFTGGKLVSVSCSISIASVNNAAAVVVGFDTDNQTATLPDPTITMAGRIIYITAPSGSRDFTLKANSGGAAEQTVGLAKNKTVMLFWNGTDWTVVSGGGQPGLQSPYGNDLTIIESAADIEIGNQDAVEIQPQKDSASPLTAPSTDNPPEKLPQTSVDGDNSNLLKLNSSSAPPKDSSNEDLFGSMYYDTSLGRVQCFEAEGWGSCGASPDSFVTISPEYTGAVMNGSDIGTITSDLCSDTLNINNGTNGQPDICGDNETYNLYNWTTEEPDNQSRSIYITHQLPANFKQFVPGSTSLIGRTDSDNAKVDYQVYRDSKKHGLITCGSAVSVSSGPQSSWQSATASSGSDPSTCGFEAGDSLLFRINLSAADKSNAYVSNLNFIFSNY